MASSEKKRQKKLEKKKTKRKEKKRELVREKTMSLAELMEQAATAPILRCWRFAGLFEQGIGQVALARQLPNGMVACAVFLVDVFCLGVKDAFGTIIGKFEFREKFSDRKLPEAVVEIEPAEARKIVEQAVEYARELGLPPHPDYHKAKPLFGDIDASECHEEFEFGQGGMPHFFAGPHDTPARCRQILATLERTCGRRNFHSTIPIPSSRSVAMVEDIEPDEDD